MCTWKGQVCLTSGCVYSHVEGCLLGLGMVSSLVPDTAVVCRVYKAISEGSLSECLCRAGVGKDEGVTSMGDSSGTNTLCERSLM